MEEYHNGVNTTQELETTLDDNNIFFREYRGDGFLSIGTDNLFIVKDHEKRKETVQTGDDTGFTFSELNIRHIKELEVEKDYPTARLERTEDAEVETQNKKPCTKVTIWIANHTVTFYIASNPHKVASAFVHFRQQS